MKFRNHYLSLMCKRITKMIRSRELVSKSHLLGPNLLAISLKLNFQKVIKNIQKSKIILIVLWEVEKLYQFQEFRIKFYGKIIVRNKQK